MCTQTDGGRITERTKRARYKRGMKMENHARYNATWLAKPSVLLLIVGCSTVSAIAGVQVKGRDTQLRTHQVRGLSPKPAMIAVEASRRRPPCVASKTILHHHEKRKRERVFNSKEFLKEEKKKVGLMLMSVQSEWFRCGAHPACTAQCKHIDTLQDRCSVEVKPARTAEGGAGREGGRGKKQTLPWEW